MRTHAFPPLLVVAATVGVDVCSVPSNNVVRDSEFLAAMGQKWTVILRKHTDAYRFCDKFGVLQKFDRISVNLVLLAGSQWWRVAICQRYSPTQAFGWNVGGLGPWVWGRIPCLLEAVSSISWTEAACCRSAASIQGEFACKHKRHWKATTTK